MKEHLYRALTTPCGIVIRTDDVQRAVQKLHAARREANDPRLNSLIVSISRDKPESEIWISHKQEGQVDAEET